MSEYDTAVSMLREREKYGNEEQHIDEAVIIAEAETEELVKIRTHFQSISTQIGDELEFRIGREKYPMSEETKENIRNMR